MVVATVVAFWIVLGVGENGTLKWYINSASVQDRVFAVQDAEMVNTINTRIEDGKEETEALAANSKTYVATWREAKKDPLARDRARFKYDAVNKIESIGHTHNPEYREHPI